MPGREITGSDIMTLFGLACLVLAACIFLARMGPGRGKDGGGVG